MNLIAQRSVGVGGIYSIVCGPKIYIGQTKDLSNRLSGHFSYLRRGIHKNPHLQAAWNKYGEDEFDFEVIEECNESIRDERERFWITFFNSLDRKSGYNIESGGLENKHHSEESRKLISDKAKGRKVSDESRLKMSLSRKGRIKSRQECEKLSKSLKGRVFTKEHCEKISKGLIGRKMSDEARQRMSASHLGKKLPEHVKEAILKVWTGRKHTPETIDKMRIAKRNMSEETKEKIRNANLGKVTSEETKEKLRIANTGRSLSEEARLKISISKLGKKRKPFTAEARLHMSQCKLGKKFTDEHKKHMSESAKRIASAKQ